MAGKGKSKGRGNKSPLKSKRARPAAVVPADALTEEELRGARKGEGSGPASSVAAGTSTIAAAVVVGALAMVLAAAGGGGWSPSSRGESRVIDAPDDASASAPQLRLPATFEHLLDGIDSPVPYRLFAAAGLSDATLVDAGTGSSEPLPPLPDHVANAFQGNPYDIVPALARAIEDHNAAVCAQLVQLLLDEERWGSGPGTSAATATATTATATAHANPMAYGRLLWKSSEAFYFTQNLELAHLRVMLLHKFFDLVFDERTGTSTTSMAFSSRQSDKRRAVEMLGQALESRAELQTDASLRDRDADAARRLYGGAVALGLWDLPDQRPQHYFAFGESGSSAHHGDPFPSADLYRGPVDVLERNWDAIRRELILHKKFPGKMDIDREHLAGGGGKWLQADFWVRGQWDADNAKRFPRTASVLKQIQDEYAQDLPDAVMQMSTMTKHTRVRPHCGSGNHKVRLHLALCIPAEGVGIRIANETGCWENGKVLPVDDSYVHSVWNDGNEPRTVLIVDVWKAGLTQDDKEKVKRYFAGRGRHLTAGSDPIIGVG